MKPIGWSNDFVALEGAAPALPQIQQVDGGRAQWIVVLWYGGVAPGIAAWVFDRDEFFARLKATRIPYQPGTQATLAEVFALRELACSTVLTGGPRPTVDVRPGRRSTTPLRTGERYVDLSTIVGDESDYEEVHAVGAPGMAVGKPGRASRFAPRAALRRAPPVTRGRPASMSPPPPPHRTRGAAPAPAPPIARATADEGTTPTRYPSIEPQGDVQAGLPISLVVDLLREESATTFGAAMFPEQAADWQAFPVEVALQSPDIDFDANGLATLTVRRNAASIAATVTGRVHTGLPPGHAIDVTARFLYGTRHCGKAARRLVVHGLPMPAPPADPGEVAVQVDRDAAQPDLTIYITLLDKTAPGRLQWLMVFRSFPGCPANIVGNLDLGHKPEVEATQLFNQFAKLQRGAHRESIEGFGELLWDKSPPQFQAIYWALCDRLMRTLAIQFVSDDPHLPWELMKPYRDGEQHEPIALRHAVGRWIVRRAGHMPNRLPKGKLLAMAPHYGIGLELPLAEAAAQALVDKLGAQRLPGTRKDLLALLETPPPDPVALLYFNGHGAFAADAAGISRLKLEDAGELTALEVGRQKVRLGERDGTLVFLNACEVGATGSVLGNVGGWADAFLGRRFGALIAPLWAIDEEDASLVTTELMDAIVTRRQPIGEALRDLRVKHGAVSPTFYSYLLYGDVTARMGTAS
jgi:CHAT domain